MPLELGLALGPGLLSGVAGLAAYLLLRARRLLRHLPPKVAQLLLSETDRQELLRLILEIAGFTHLSKEKRRDLALDFVTRWLNQHGVALSDHEIALLVELLYSAAHRHHAERIAPAPL